MSDLSEYQDEIFNEIAIGAETNEVFPEESFFEYVTELLGDAGIIDNVEYRPYKNTRKGVRIDGYSWNALERTIYGIVVDFSNDTDEIRTLTKTEIVDIGKRVTRFFDNVVNPSFLELLEITDPGRIAATEIGEYLPETLKFRVLVFTDRVLSSRVRKLSIEKILDRDTSIEIWDLERLMALEKSESEYEEFTVDLEIHGGAIRALPANASEHGVSTYLCVMPALLLSSIYHEFGQRLLESNVRTFLDFRAATNRGMRKSLVTEPEHFFAYNNGITVTASGTQTEERDGQIYVTAIENMQIVNGGQTTAAIYFAPREKGGLKSADGTHNYSDIDLEKVFVQMKLTVVGDKEASDVMKANIATYANSQNSIQQSDLVSNHPFHLNIETRSRKQLMPAGENGLSTKWFYERARGQYSTQLRALTAAQRNRFEMEYPKNQVFNKTDMAKYENTWRMKPYTVKRGAQANLKALGTEIIREFEADESAFGPSFYQDLVAKMILFRSVDAAVLRAEWYKAERGLKAEIVTYSIALLRHALIEQGKDISLPTIYRNQCVSTALLETLVSLAEVIREKITDVSFTGGVTNPSEFCKSEAGWAKIQAIAVDLSQISEIDVLAGDDIRSSEKEKRAVNKASESITGLELVMSVSPEEWELIAEFFAVKYPQSHKNVGIPRKCVSLYRTGQMLSDKQMKAAKEIREHAYAEGFDFIAS